MRIPAGVIAILTTIGLTTTGIGVPTPAGASVRAALPRPDHVVILIEENHAFSAIIGRAGYLTGLSSGGALFTQSFAIGHPSQPNYLALFSGSTQGLADDSCPHTFSGANLASELIATGQTFAGYSETMSVDGFTGCASGQYKRKHNPWVNFSNVPASANLRFSRFPTDFASLPTVSVVVPNQDDDMHDGTVAAADAWAKSHLDPYARWAKTHNSLLIVTFDEGDLRHANQIATIFAGQPVQSGSYPERIDHYAVLRTIEDMYGLPCTGNPRPAGLAQVPAHDSACGARPITDVWR